MASTKIDELQLQISSDASTAITQLGQLAAALNGAAQAANGLANANGALTGFANGLKAINTVDLNKTVTELKKLEAINFRKLKNKKVNIDISVNGLDRLEKFTNTVLPSLNGANLKGTGISSVINSFKRLASVDMTKFDTTVLNKMVQAVVAMGKVGNISKSINKFVSSLASLANAGDKTKATADGLRVLIPRLKDAVKAFQKLGTIDGKINQFIAGLASLASAGGKTAITAANLQVLTKEVLAFLKAMRNAPKIDPNLAMTIQGLGNLAAAGQKVGKTLSTAGANSSVVGIFTKSLGAGVRSVTNDLKKLLSLSIRLGISGVKSIGSFMQKLGLLPRFSNGIDRTALSFTNLLRAILPFYGIRGVFDWLKDAVTAGSSIVEIENVIDTAFGSLKKGYADVSGYVYRWSKSTIDAFGVSELAAKRYAGRLMSMFNSSGFDVSEGMRNSAAKMTTDLVERAGDIASFYDISVDEAMTKMQSGLAGMTRPLRSLGVNMSVANMEAFALSQGITTAWQSMDQASQMALRYQYILHATQYAEGDFTRTQLSMANQVRLLQLNFEMLSTTMGQGLISAIAPVISWLNALIKRLIQAANAFRIFMWTLFGKPIAAAKGVVDEMAEYLDDASGSASDLGGAGGDAADGLGSAGSAAKDLKKQLSLLPFDQLNQLAKDTDTSSGGSGGGGGGGGAGGLGDLSGLSLEGLDEMDFDSSPTIEAINRWAARIREAFEKGQWASLGHIVAEGINAGFQYIYDALDWEKIKPIVVDGFIVPFQTSFNSMMDWIDWTLIGQTLARGLNDVTYTLRAWITGFHWRDFGGYFAEGMNSFVNDWDADAFGRLIADKFKAAWDVFGGFVEGFDFSNLGTRIKEMVLGFFDEINGDDMGQSLANFFNGIADAVISFCKDGEVRASLASEFSGFVNGFIKQLDGDDIKEAMSLLKDTLGGAISDAFWSINKLELASDIGAVLSELPWGVVGTAIAIKAAGSMAASLFGAFFKVAAKAAIIKALEGITLSGLAVGLATITAAVLAIGAITIGGIALGEWIKRNGWGKFNTSAQTQREQNAEGHAKNQKVLEQAGMNYAGQYTSTQTQTINEAPAVTSATQKVTQFLETIFTGKEDKSYADITKARSAIIDAPYAKMIMEGVLTGKFKTASDAWHAIFSKTETKTVSGNETGSYKSIRTGWQNWISQTILKTANSTATGAYVSIKGGWFDWISQTINKITDSEATGAYLAVKKGWFAWVAETILKTANGDGTSKYWTLSDDYQGLESKDITLSVNQNRGFFQNLGATIENQWNELIVFDWYAKGGYFTGASLIGVGEAGDEAAIPLERRSTMRKIGRAIVDAGGMGIGSNSSLATEIAREVAPVVASIVTGQNQRPITVNATLYTENNEVLARAVNQGNRSLDKRYNPVAQYSY